jgi:hypothetical protein
MPLVWRQGNARRLVSCCDVWSSQSGGAPLRGRSYCSDNKQQANAKGNCRHMRDAATKDEGRSAMRRRDGGRVSLFGVLLFVLAIVSQVGLPPLRAVASEHGTLCEKVVARQSADRQSIIEREAQGEQRVAHCVDCPMLAQTIAHRVAEPDGERIATPIVFDATRPVARRERRRDGGTRSRAPPHVS